MTDTNEKPKSAEPREFWIRDTPHMLGYVYSSKHAADVAQSHDPLEPLYQYKKPHIHVIEFSAFEKLQAERDLAVADAEVIENQRQQLVRERDELRAELNSAYESVNKVHSDWNAATKENAALTKERDELLNHINSGEIMSRGLHESRMKHANRELKEQALKLREALEFYSKKENYSELHDFKGLHKFTNIGDISPIQDDGKRAREALAAFDSFLKEGGK